MFLERSFTSPHTRASLSPAVILLVVLFFCACSPEHQAREADVIADTDATRDSAGGVDADATSHDGADVESMPDAGADDDIRQEGDGEQALHLPLEILGAPGTAMTTTIDIDPHALDGARSAHLHLTAHNIVAPASAEVIVNNRTIIDLSARGGPLFRTAGGAATGALALAIEDLQSGENTLTFRYTRQVPEVSGFRILDVTIDVDGARFDTALPYDDPATWSPLRGDPESIEEGRRYFQEVSRDGGPFCGECHPRSGADLKYFGFSDKSLIARAVFHEFSQEEAESIASYIRALPVTTVSQAYQPPFQPGASNYEAAGAGLESLLEGDDAFAAAVFGDTGLPEEIPWDWPASIDLFSLPATFQMPSWARWLPRELEDEWLDLRDGLVRRTLASLEDEPSEEAAREFMTAVIEVGKDLLLLEGDHIGRIELLRMGATKLWEWSRQRGFGDEDHGFPSAGPHYPYEVGFAFFEAGLADPAFEDAMLQTMEWWWTQLAVNHGRGRSTGERPLNWQDVLLAAEAARFGPYQIAFLHLLGSWEDSLGEMAERFGTDRGPVRTLLVPMRNLSSRDRTIILHRFLLRQATFVAEGGRLTDAHTLMLERAWQAGCQDLTPTQHQRLLDAATDDVHPLLQECP